MALDRETLARLVAEIDGFYMRDRALVRAQAKMRDAVATGGEIDSGLARAYLKILKSYFERFASEAKARVVDVERRLARTSQLQYNLTAERGVAAERATLVQGVLARIEELARR